MINQENAAPPELRHGGQFFEPRRPAIHACGAMNLPPACGLDSIYILDDRLIKDFPTRCAPSERQDWLVFKDGASIS